MSLHNAVTKLLLLRGARRVTCPAMTLNALMDQHHITYVRQQP
jgi:hypothetical protein